MTTNNTWSETPEAKAKEIYEKMFQQRFVIAGSYTLFQQVAKACAVILCDEMIEGLKKLNPDYDKTTYWHPIDFWQQVKQILST